MEFVVKKCLKCGKERKYVKDTLRDQESICGNCWDWSIDDKEFTRLKNETPI